jgi:DNA polymerase-3 subunit chi
MPPRVTFYVLPDAEGDARLGFACRLVEKAYLQDHRVTVRMDTADEARQFDELLWRFSDRSFVPHEVAAPGSDVAAPVAILAGGEPTGPADVLVNLGSDVPDWFDRFERVTEVLDASEACRRAGRERFRFYRERGLEPETHNLGAS